MYTRITKTFLDDITIRITREYGVNISFDSDMNVMIVLHFKRVM